MKKLYILFFTILISSLSFGQNPIITTISDGDCTGGNPKTLEIYADGTVDFSLYSLERMSNGGSWGSTTNLTALGTVTNDFVYIYSDSSSPEVFSTEYPSATIAIENSVVNVNGDDGLRIILDSDSSIIDQYGADATDGTGEVWEYADGFAKRIDGTGPDGGFTVANWTFSNGALNNGGICQGGSTFEFIMGGIGTYSTTPSTEPTLFLIDGPASGSTIEVGPEDLAGDLEFGTTNFVVDTPSAGDGYIKWSFINATDGGTIHASGDIFDTSQVYPFAALDPFKTYILNAELVDNSGASLSSPVVYTITANTLGYNDVTSVANLRAVTDNGYYRLTTEAFLTFQQSFRGQKFIQDATGGILIDDNDGVISSTYAINDGITNIRGQVSEFAGMKQFVPSTDYGASSSSNNTITPQAVSLLDLSTNPEQYESELVTVTNVTLDNTIQSFAGGSEHTMSQGMDLFQFRSTFFDANYVTGGGIVPTDPTNITGIINERSGNSYFLTARSTDDFSVSIVLSTGNIEKANFALYPNPTSTGQVFISSANSSEVMAVSVYDILGKQVKNETISNNRLDVSNLKSGVYILRITQNNASSTKKLVIK